MHDEFAADVRRYPDLYVKNFSVEYRECVSARAGVSMRHLEGMLDAISGTVSVGLADRLVPDDATAWLSAVRRLRRLLRDSLGDALRETNALITRMAGSESEYERNECCMQLLQMIELIDTFISHYGNMLIDAGVPSQQPIPQVWLRGSVH